MVDGTVDGTVDGAFAGTLREAVDAALRRDAAAW